MYVKGEGLEKDAVQAVRWFRKAAVQGYAAAQYNLGCMYFSGDGVQQNDCEAARWWQMAADQGHAKAHYCLGQVTEQQGNYQAAIAHYRAGQASSGPKEARACIRRCAGAVVLWCERSRRSRKSRRSGWGRRGWGGRRKSGMRRKGGTKRMGGTRRKDGTKRKGETKMKGGTRRKDGTRNIAVHLTQRARARSSG
jgi:TPR repeat protein